ncbi:acetate kinase [Spiroplasma chinense]|uniref:Acetate kinase n=1 Tax=Spiroplasma chinense TaxID=216932 RepID=A0A5B9Y503_9MOLU|nr:acetate kinase [Spiroplasma chinense]QEH62248.1 acetate kinase [Spiroplasma chinense]
MILIVNAGSSSIKFKLYSIEGKTPNALVEGLAERITVDGALTIKVGDQKHEFDDKMSDHLEAVTSILNRFKELEVIKNEEDIKGIGFRIVHGGDKVVKPVELTDEMKKVVEENIRLAPLHNPGALTAINAFESKMPKAKLVGCFDTSFHQTMPKEKFLYPTPYSWYEDHAVRKYGMHGISYDYITLKAAEMLNKKIDDVNLIICHLGNGASICCVKNGKSLDTTMGLTPLAGVMMGTRAGDIDSSIIQYISKETGMDLNQVTDALNKESGLLGVSGISSDMRDVTTAVEKGDERATLALDMYATRISDYIVKYANYLENKVDAIIFTAGVGENSAAAKKAVIDKVKLLNVTLDDTKNSQGYDDYLEISTPDSQVPIYKVRTDEELMICNTVLKFL